MKRVFLLLLPLLALTGCVERKMHIRSEPAGADVWVNRSAESPQKTPCETEFQHHGTFAVRLEKEGYLPAEERARVPTPWYSWPILDFITEVLLPFTIRDHHEFEFRLEPVPKSRPWSEAEADIVRHREEVFGRAEALRRETMGTVGGSPTGVADPAGEDEP